MTRRANTLYTVHDLPFLTEIVIDHEPREFKGEPPTSVACLDATDFIERERDDD